MSRSSRLRQRRARLEHERETAPIVQPQQEVQVGLEQLVPMLQQSNPTQYALAVNIDPPVIRLALKVGPIMIPCDITEKERAEDLLTKLDEAIGKAWPENAEEEPQQPDDIALPEHLANLLTDACSNVQAKAEAAGNGVIVTP